MLWAVNLLVLQEAAVALASAHEVVVRRAGGEAAADSRPRLLTPLAVLRTEHERRLDSVRQRQTRGNREGTLRWTYKFFPPQDRHVDVLQGAVVVLKHLCRPQRAVDMGPLVLADVQQPSLVLKEAPLLQRMQ